MAAQFEEGTVTILFTDVERSTDLGAAGDVSAREVMRAHDEIVRAQIERHSGREIKTLGDGFMVGFTSARRAVACAVGIQRSLAAARHDRPEPLPPVRIGLNTGEVVHDDDDMFGTAVAAAARITARAKGGQILAPPVVRALVGTLPDIEFRPAGRHALKGFEEEWELLEIGWDREPAPFRSGARTPLVGREVERAELCRLLDRLEDNKGGLALIAGEPGVGKTRLAEEVARDAKKRGHRVLVGRCYDVDTPAPYLPFVEILESAAKDVDRETFRLALGDAAGEIAKVMPQLRNVFDDLPPGLELPPEQERRYLFNSIGEFIERAASVTPVVVLLDDLHWADQPSLALLESVARRLDRMPVVVIGTYRNMELDLHRPLSRTLDELLRQRLAQRTTLKRLSEDGVRTMLTRLAGSPPPPQLVTIVFNETDGNPFFVEELFRHLCDESALLDNEGNWRTDLELEEVDVPEGIRLVLGRRLERLEEPAVKVLTLAAILGRTFEYELLAASSDESEDVLLDAIEAAERLTLISPLDATSGEARYEFVHELIRQTLLGGVSTPRRQRMHLTVAGAMEKLYDASLAERAAEILNHLYQAGSASGDQAVRLLLLAGTRARESAAFEESLRLFEEALALIGDDDPATKARALVGLGHAQSSLGRVDQAVLNWSEALTLLDECGDRDTLGDAGQNMVLHLGWAGHWEELVQIAGRVLGLLSPQPTHPRALLLAFGAIGLSWAGFHDPAQDMFDEALAIAHKIGEDEVIGQIQTAEASHHYAFGRLFEALEVGRQAMSRLEAGNAQWNYATALAFVTLSRAFTGQIDGLENEIRKIERISERLGFGGGMMFAQRARYGLALCEARNVAVIEKIARRDLEICEEYDLPWAPQGHLFLSSALFRKGDLEGALEHARLGKEQDPPSVLYGFGLGTLFLYSAYAGNHDDVLKLWDEMTPILPEAGVANPFGRQCLLDYAIDGFYMLGEHERAAALYDLLLQTWTGIPLRFSGVTIETVAGISATAGKRWDLAREHFEKGLEVVTRNRMGLARIETLRFYGDMLIRSGDIEGGRKVLTDAAAGYSGAGMVFHQTLVRKMLDAGAPMSLER